MSAISLRRALRSRSWQMGPFAALGLEAQQLLDARVSIDHRCAILKQTAGVRGRPVRRIDGTSQKSEVHDELRAMMCRMGEAAQDDPAPRALHIEEPRRLVEPRLRLLAKKSQPLAGSGRVMEKE